MSKKKIDLRQQLLLFGIFAECYNPFERSWFVLQEHVLVFFCSFGFAAIFRALKLCLEGISVFFFVLQKFLLFG